MDRSVIPIPVKNVTVVGYANKDNLYVSNWRASLQQSGFNYQLLGSGQKWTGLVTRIKAYLYYLESQANDDSHLYNFIDVYDVIAVGSASELMKKWSTYGSPIVIGGEPNCNANLCRPITKYWEHWNMAGQQPNIYLNFGLVAGIRSTLIHFFQYLIADSERSHPKIWNEQIAASHYLDANPKQVALDYRMQLIGNMICHPTRGNVSQFGWLTSERRVYYNFRPTMVRSKPIFIHCPSKGIDGLQRYNNYGYLILGKQWLRPGRDMLTIPGYLWVWLAILIAILILWAVLGSQKWIIIAFVIIWAILILYVISSQPHICD